MLNIYICGVKALAIYICAVKALAIYTVILGWKLEHCLKSVCVPRSGIITKLFVHCLYILMNLYIL